MAPPKKYRAPCARCGVLPACSPGRRFCSLSCARPKRIATCARCGAPFVMRDAEHRFCSRSCVKPVVMHACVGCGRLFKRDRVSHVACSLACRGAAVSGPRSGRWKGGVTPDDSRSRWTSRYRKWRLAVLERDGRRCRACGSGERLEVDHIRGWAKYPALRYRPSNGRVLCRPCHQKRRNHGRASEKRASPSPK